MGLDIAFNRGAAIKAGLILTQERNGTDDYIAWAKANDEDTDFIAYLERVENVVQVPGTNLHVCDDGIGDSIIVRANKWGSVYAPLTTWLHANNITWSEF
jgi:hypothetical protein